MVMDLLIGSAGKGVEQPTELMAMEGASAQVNCTYQTSGFNGLFWYQQHDGGAPVFLSYNVLDGLETRGHFSSFLSRFDAHSYLLLKELHMKDFASYLCAVIDTVTVRSFQLLQNTETTTPVRSYISWVHACCKLRVGDFATRLPGFEFAAFHLGSLEQVSLSFFNSVYPILSIMKAECKELMLLNCGVGDYWESLGLQGDQNSPY